MAYLGIDIETEDPFLKDRGKQKAKGPSWIFGEGRVLCVGAYNGKEKKAFDGDGGEFIEKVLRNSYATIVGANIQYDIGWLLSAHKMSIDDVRCGFIDVALTESLIDEYQPYDLDSLALKYLGEHKGKSELEDIAARLGLKGDFRQHLGRLWDEGYQEEIKRYVISDADQPVRIWHEQKKIILEQNLVEAFQMEMNMIPVVISMQQKGVRIDVETWKSNCEKAKEAYDRLKNEFETKYDKVNINSPMQVAALMDRWNVPYKKKITIKGFSLPDRKFTSNDCFKGDALTEHKQILRKQFSGVTVEKGRIVLYLPKQYADRTATEISDMGYEVVCNPVVGKPMYQEQAASYPIVADLVQYKQIKSLVDKFLGPVFGRFIAPDGRLHATFNIAGARQTNRMSCTKPNLQQCLAEGSRVLTDKGYVPIEKLKIGDKVFNGNGDLTTVTNVWYKGIKNCIWTVCANNQFRIATTPDHKFWNGKMWQNAEELNHADIIQSRTGSLPLQALFDIETDWRSVGNKQGYSGELCSEIYAGRRKSTDSDLESQENCDSLYARGTGKKVCRELCFSRTAFVERPVYTLQNIFKKRTEFSSDISDERAESRTTQPSGSTSKIQEKWPAWKTCSNLQRRVLGWQRIYNSGKKRCGCVQKSCNTQSCIRRCFKNKRMGFTEVLTRTSFGQEPLKQQLGQLGAVFTKSTQAVTQTACGLRKVYDIEVASPDHSFIAEGFRVHNCPSKTKLFEKTANEVDLAKLCRECFVPEPGECFVKLDFSGQENRMVAHFAEGKNGDYVQKKYNENPYFDEHSYVTEVSGLGAEHGAKVGRKFAKNLRFGVGYGMQKPRMMQNFGWTKEFCDDLYEKVAGAAPWLFEVMDKVQDVVVKRRYIRTLAGRRIHLRKGRDHDAYKYMNYLIQGSAADMTKKATVNIWKSHSCETMLLTVHDEDCFSVPMNERGVERIVELKHWMEHSSDLRVPAVCDPEIGPNWADGIEYSPEYGDLREFIRTVFKAMKNGTFYELKKSLDSFDKDKESFTEFCENLDSEEEDDENV